MSRPALRARRQQALQLALPKHYRRHEVMAFHARDPEQTSERVSADRICKAVVLFGVPAVIRIKLDDQSAHASLSLARPLALAPEFLHRLMGGMLGLSASATAFERVMQRDALLRPLLAHQRGLCIPQTATPFEALTWAIIGQQINVPFAVQLRRRLIQLAQVEAPGLKLLCYPDAHALAGLSLAELQAQQFSRAKAKTVLRVASLVANGELPLDDWWANQADPAEIEARLLAIKGIGPWTAHYMMLRGFGLPDCSLQGDVAVRKAIARLLGQAETPGLVEAETFLARYAPHRSLLAAHLWASLRLSA